MAGCKERYRISNGLHNNNFVEQLESRTCDCIARKFIGTLFLLFDSYLSSFKSNLVEYCQVFDQPTTE